MAVRPAGPIKVPTYIWRPESQNDVVGVKISFGTDAGVFPHGLNAKQFAYMVKYGQTPMQAIQSATVVSSELLGWNKKIGSIEKGKYADIIAVKTNPLDDIKILENVSFVMKGGTVYKNKLSARPAGY